MHRKCVQRILADLKKSVELRTRHRMRRVDFRGSQRPDEFACYGRHTRWEADRKVIIERLCISLPYVETFNSKVIKGFVPELRSHKCFSCFGIPMFYVYMLWTFYVRFTYSYLAMLHSKLWRHPWDNGVCYWRYYYSYSYKRRILERLCPAVDSIWVGN